MTTFQPCRTGPLVAPYFSLAGRAVGIDGRAAYCIKRYCARRLGEQQAAE